MWAWDYYSTWTLNKISYYFNNYTDLKSDTWDYNMWTCTQSTKYYLWDNDTPTKEAVECITTSTWSIKIYTWDLIKNFNSTVDYSIKISNIIWDLSASWIYYTKLSFFDSWTKKHEQYFTYFTQWDNDITTLWDNTLKVHKTGLDYPTWIWWIWNQYKEFYKNIIIRVWWKTQQTWLQWLLIDYTDYKIKE